MGYHSILLLSVIPVIITGYIIDNGQQPDCWGVACYNDGTLDSTSCTCSCHVKFTGLFCETETKDTQWPRGRYSMLSTVFGCPEELEHGWHTGYVNMTLGEELPVQAWKMPHPTNFEEYPIATPDPHILGPYSYRLLQLNFCTRDDVPDGGTIDESKWPGGEYCVFKYGSSCPIGFQESRTTLGDYHLSWSDTDGVIPHVKIDNDTSGAPTFHFCCNEEQAEVDNNQTFPTTFPFIMLKTNTSSCPIITGMTLSEERFDFVEHTRMFEFNGSTSVFKNTGNGYERLELCYYAHDSRRECWFAIDGGFSYRGTRDYSHSGKSCIHWFDVKEKYNENFRPHRQYGGDDDFDNNYCRTFWPWGTLKNNPSCSVYVNETGTSEEQVIEACDIPLCDIDPDLEAVESKKPVYSSEYVTGKASDYAVDGLLSEPFVAKRPENKPWIQVDLEENLEVHAIFVQRTYVWFPNNLRFPGVYVSKNQWDFINYGARQCVEKNFPRRAHRFWYECYRPIIGQYVTIRNFDNPDPLTLWGKDYILEIQEITVYYKRGVCSRRLGLISGGVRDFQLGGSGDENKYMFDYGRLYHAGSGWCSSGAGPKYFEIDTIVPTVIHGFELQGTSDGTYDNVDEITVEYGISKEKMVPYLNANGQPKRFHIDETGKADMVHRFLFYQTFVSRHFRIIVTSPAGGPICMKMELIGCPKRIIRDTTCSKPGAIDIGYDVIEHTGFWMDVTSIKHESLVECLEECNKVQCFSIDYSKPFCNVLNSSRYNPHFEHWVVTNLDRWVGTYTRLCISDVLAYDDCNELVTSPTVIESPLYPQYYGQLVQCVWTFQFPPGKYPRLQFLHLTLPTEDKLSDMREEGHFDVSIGSCKDMLSFGELNIDANLADAYRNSLFIASTPHLTLTLKSCARYSKAPAVSFRINVTYSDIPGCGFLSEGSADCKSENGIIASTGYPTSIPGFLTKFWLIQGRRGQYVELFIKALYLPGSSNDCRQHSITLEDQSLQYAFTQIGTYCSSKDVLEPIKSNWHTMRVTFRTGDVASVTENLKGVGFLAEYTLVQFVQDITSKENPDCPSGWEYYNQSCYQMFSDNDGLTWLRGEELCTEFEGHLVSLQSRGEVDFIHYLLTEKWTDWAENVSAQGDFYIGLKKTGYGGHFSDFEWTDGSPATFLAWNKGTGTTERQPNGLNNELCTFLRLSSILSTENWHDVACAFDSINHYICETRIFSNETDHVATIVPFAKQFNFSYDGFLPCDSGEILPFIFACDGISHDCFDNSDETRFCLGKVFDECPPGRFRCNDKECIEPYLVCDFNKDCSNGEDEEKCVYQTCKFDEWECKSGQCIPYIKRCDVNVDCLDGSDEEDCAVCQGLTFQCFDQRCLPEARVCDSFIDCTGLFHEDELNGQCLSNARSSCLEWYYLGQRSNGTYLINLYGQESFQVECRFGWRDGQPMVETVLHHDAENMLSWENGAVTFPIRYPATDGQIELIKHFSSHCEQYIKVGCQQTTFWLRWVAFDGTYYENRNRTEDCDCPYVNQCETSTKQCNCQSESHTDWFNEKYYEVRYDEGYITNQQVLPIKQFETPQLTSPFKIEVQLTIGPLICVEANLESDYGSLMVCRNGHITSMDHMCVMDMDTYGDAIGCRDLSHLEDCVDFVCPTNFLKCPHSFCIPTRYMCDGTNHCPGGEDEDSDVCSDTGYCVGLYRCRGTPICIPSNQVCDGISHCPRKDDEAMCIDTCQSGCNCSKISTECYAWQFTSNLTVNTQYPDIKYLLVNGQMFQFSAENLYPYPLIRILQISNCGIRKMEPSQFSTTPNLIMLDLSRNQIHHLVHYTFQGLVMLRTLLLNGNPLTYIAPLAFFNLESITNLDLSGFALDLVEVDMFYGLDSLKILNLSTNAIKRVTEKVFEPLDTLQELDIRGNDILEFDKDIFFGLDSLALMYTDSFTLCCVLPQSLPDGTCVSPRNEFSSCDDLMRNEVLRVAIWIIGIAAFIGNIVVLIIRFYVERESLGKTYSIFVSNLSVADFLMGIYLIIIATTDTLFRGSYVWNDYSWRNGDWCKTAGVLATVGSEGSVLFLCLITLDRLLVVKFPFGNVRISRQVCVTLCATVWVVVFALAVVPLSIHPAFYSRSAVCLALPLTRDRPEGWQYGIGVFIVFNFLAFLMIAIAQIAIYLEVSSSRRKTASRGRRMDMAIARKLFFVAITDFLCWFPVGLMGLLALDDHVISGEVYAWIAVFVLPINSAINPFLYTLGTSLSQAKLTITEKLASQKEDKSGSISKVFDSELFMFGSMNKPATKLKMSLEKYLTGHRLDTKNAHFIVLKISRALELLHCMQLVHGSLNSSAVIVTITSKGKIKRVVLKSSPWFCSEEEAFKKDIYDIGEILKQIVRNLNGTK